MDVTVRRLLENSVTEDEINSFNKIKHSYNVEYVTEEMGIGDIRLKYRCVRDLRNILISSIISSRYLTRVKPFEEVLIDFMGFDHEIPKPEFTLLASICFSDEIDNSVALGYGDIALGNELCKDKYKGLLERVLCMGYGINDIRIQDIDCKDMCFNLTYKEVMQIPNGLLFVKSIAVPVVEYPLTLRNMPTQTSAYEGTVTILKDIGAYIKVMDVINTTYEADTPYLLFREKVVNNLAGVGIEVVDSLVEKPRIISSCPVSISYMQLEDMFLHCILDKLTSVY